MLRRDAAHLENGAIKYGDNNWMKGQPLSRYYDSTMRHLLAVREGREDEDHLAAARWNLMAIMWTLEEVREGRLPITLVDLPYHLGPTSPIETVAGGRVEQAVEALKDVVVATPLLVTCTDGGEGVACKFCGAARAHGDEHRRWCQFVPVTKRDK